MLARIFNPPKQSFFLLGPRGSGKSTWLRAVFHQAHLIVYPRGPALRTQDGIEVLPFKDFSNLLAAGAI